MNLFSCTYLTSVRTFASWRATCQLSDILFREKPSRRQMIGRYGWESWATNEDTDNKLYGRPPQYAPAPCKLTFDLESGVRITCDAGYLCANFNLPRPLCSRLRPDVRDRQTSDARYRLMPPSYGGGRIIKRILFGNKSLLYLQVTPPLAFVSQKLGRFDSAALRWGHG